MSVRDAEFTTGQERWMGGKEQLFQSGVSVWASGRRVGQGVCGDTGEPCTRPQLQASTVGLARAHTAGATFGEERAMGVNDSTGKDLSTATGQRGRRRCTPCHSLISLSCDALKSRLATTRVLISKACPAEAPLTGTPPSELPAVKLWSAAAQFPLNPDYLVPERATWSARCNRRPSFLASQTSQRQRPCRLFRPHQLITSSYLLAGTVWLYGCVPPQPPCMHMRFPRITPPSAPSLNLLVIPLEVQPPPPPPF
ncbi:hypothetical protein PTRG_11622 [Pyrenophora tritici-repentis Pt-1C-BFP]|uniref:Uncharacterized protein n=1 Tax=Pyrenophora tritici-repentis (strain Pt-1C-BFP) TaxID=426418 RepID=B2WNR2_PYRTR|nr:uncharacterized protein PTRG_11622 [Pyrenophora tritici-repentis Pt-1C-BFP]EDU44672.1 hypothetical protein PTRG_11622 [Pyrenophora tritici-repentis Pt-1C-BFP]